MFGSAALSLQFVRISMARGEIACVGKGVRGGWGWGSQRFAERRGVSWAEQGGSAALARAGAGRCGPGRVGARRSAHHTTDRQPGARGVTRGHFLPDQWEKKAVVCFGD